MVGTVREIERDLFGYQAHDAASISGLSDLLRLIDVVLSIPTLPLIFANTLGLRPTVWLMMVPSLSQHFLVTGLLRGEPVSPLYAALSVSVSLVLGVAAAYGAGRLYHREALLG